MKDESLIQKLKTYSGRSLVPMHMPGHKRNPKAAAGLPCRLDITEIGDFDNLHFPTGILRSLCDRIAAVYGGDSAFALVNGSTCGILAGIYSAVKPRGKVILGINCHKSVYNGIGLRQAECTYIYPECDGMIFSAVTPQMVKSAIEKAPDAELVIITSPTYEGVVSDIAGIAEICHDAGIPLMVDAAHGAHLGFVPGCPGSPTECGADIAVYSLHKTLPSLTQTAVAVLRGGLVPPERFAGGLGIFETSSPSYLLLASIDSCISYLESERGKKDFVRFSSRIDEFYIGTVGLKRIKVMGYRRRDKSRITIITAGSGINGSELYDALEKDYGIVCEMAGINHVIAIPSVCDKDDALRSLAAALYEIDRGLEGSAACDEAVFHGCAPLIRKISADEASFAPFEIVPGEKAVGRISAASVYAYPPGIPITLPGCVITEETVRAAEFYVENKIRLENSKGMTAQGFICVK